MAEAGLAGLRHRHLVRPVGAGGHAEARSIDKLARARNEALKAGGGVARRCAPQGIDPLGGSPDEFARHIESDTRNWTTVAKAAGLKK